MAAVYLETMKAVVAAVDGRPEAETARRALAKIKEGAVGQLVALGRKRATLDDAGRTLVDQRVRMGLGRVPSDLFTAFSAAHKHYMAAHRETGNLLASFNVITQYADFELLKKQDPEEFDRLGLGE